MTPPTLWAGARAWRVPCSAAAGQLREAAAITARELRLTWLLSEF